jgi:hypothetical protein
MENEHSDRHFGGVFDILCPDCMIDKKWTMVIGNPVIVLFVGRKFAQIPLSMNTNWIDSF